MPITSEVLTRLGVSRANADRHLEALNAAMAQHGIDTPLRIAHFLAQVVHESGHLKHVEENLNYSADGLANTWPARFGARDASGAYLRVMVGGRSRIKPNAAALQLQRKPEAIANACYASRMGNRDPASGDGWRYRGRGLIQLTGRDNYREFGRWVGEDVLADPDAVAGRHCARSAVFFWNRRGLNALADIDDLHGITRAINGGLNGFAARRELLEKARRALRELLPVAPGAGPALTPTHRVVPAQLNLRSAPQVSPATWIATLNQGSEVELCGEADSAGWVKVRVVVNRVLREGHVAQRYLAELPARARAATPEAAPAPALPAIPAVHMEENRADVIRARDGGRAYPLGEPDRPRRRAASAAGRAAMLREIVDYLDVAAPAHLRYRPKGGSTYCNIYACDYCYLAGAYLPRVWWTDRALQRIALGESVAVAYGDTVRELNANALHDWLEEHGTRFGWHREFDLSSLQAAANAGEVCLVVARRKDLNRSGHIVAVVPEDEDRLAHRDAVGEVLRPLESQAGTRNFRHEVSRSAWWREARFQSHAYWRHP